MADEAQTLKAELKRVKDENQSLQSQNHHLAVEYQKLQRQNQRLTHEIEVLRCKIRPRRDVETWSLQSRSRGQERPQPDSYGNGHRGSIDGSIANATTPTTSEQTSTSGSDLFVLVTATDITQNTPKCRQPPVKQRKEYWKSYAKSFIESIPKAEEWPRRRKKLGLEDEHGNSRVVKEILYGLEEVSQSYGPPSQTAESSAEKSLLDAGRRYALRLRGSKDRHSHEGRIIFYQEMVLAAYFGYLRQKGISVEEVDDAMRPAFPDSDSRNMYLLRRGGRWIVDFTKALHEGGFGSLAGEVPLVSGILWQFGQFSSTKASTEYILPQVMDRKPLSDYSGTSGTMMLFLPAFVKVLARARMADVLQAFCFDEKYDNLYVEALAACYGDIVADRCPPVGQLPFQWDALRVAGSGLPRAASVGLRGGTDIQGIGILGENKGRKRKKQRTEEVDGHAPTDVTAAPQQRPVQTETTIGLHPSTGAASGEQTTGLAEQQPNLPRLQTSLLPTSFQADQNQSGNTPGGLQQRTGAPSAGTLDDDAGSTPGNAAGDSAGVNQADLSADRDQTPLYMSDIDDGDLDFDEFLTFDWEDDGSQALAQP